jgi:low temperature requirement protein LtrA
MALTKWQAPTLRHTAEDGGRVGWLELFFDLIYVAALIQLGDQLADDVSWEGAARFGGAFIVLWWTWTGTTSFMNWFAVDDVWHRLLTFMQMFAVGNFAILAVSSVEDRSRWLAIAYVAARIPLFVMYLRARRAVESTQPVTDRYLQYFVAGAAIWLASLAVPTPARYWVWALGLAVELLAPAIASRRDEAPPSHEHHYRERYALFTIIVLGETFVKTLTELTRIGISIETQVFGGIGFLILIALWWTYFDDVAESNIRRRSWFTPSPLNNRVIWVYAHLPLAMGLTAFGVASKKVVGVEAFADDLKESYTWLLAGSLIVVLLSVTVLDLVTASPHHAVDSPERVGPRVAAAFAVAGIGALMLAGALTALVGLALLAVVAVGQIAGEVVVAATRERQLLERLHGELELLHGTCADLAIASLPAADNHGCPTCIDDDTTWVQLRLCLDCGHVACCDDSPGRHATAHHHETGHAVIATLEPGETWAYCFAHDTLDPDWRTTRS